MIVRRYVVGDCRETLRELEPGIARCCVTSPPYWGLRDYGVDGQIGLEETPSAYVAALVEVFREVRRVLADDGTLWLNLGDSYACSPNGSHGATSKLTNPERYDEASVNPTGHRKIVGGLKPKDLVGAPWRVALALQADGWWLRSDLVWAKPNPMPESVSDRPTRAHEYVFLLAKSERYFYDAAAIAEPATGRRSGNRGRKSRSDHGGLEDTSRHQMTHVPWDGAEKRNARDVWSIPSQPYAGAHFATMPPELARRCIAAGSALGDVVLDPFGGSGTTALVAEEIGRGWILCDLNAEYESIARERVQQLGLLGRSA